MARFLISYDLIGYKDYQKLWRVLQRNGAIRVLASTWCISANSTVDQVFNWLKQYIDNDDKLLVVEIGGIIKRS